MTKAMYKRKTFNWKLAYTFRGSVNGPHCGKYTGIVLEQHLRALNRDPQAAGREGT